MKSIKLIAMALLLFITWSSCIREEAPNSEADITACILPKELLMKPNIDVNRSFDPELNAYPIFLHLKNEVDITKLAPEFELTEGATISPKSGSIQDFTENVYYKVTSEDQNWSRDYVLIAEQQKPDPEDPEDNQEPTIFHFENMKLSKGNEKGEKVYQIFYEKISNRTIDWASGNGGYAITDSNAEPEEYPTFLSEKGAH